MNNNLQLMVDFDTGKSILINLANEDIHIEKNKMFSLYNLIKSACVELERKGLLVDNFGNPVVLDSNNKNTE